jgi:hypothetical protein
VFAKLARRQVFFGDVHLFRPGIAGQLQDFHAIRNAGGMGSCRLPVVMKMTLDKSNAT